MDDRTLHLPNFVKRFLTLADSRNSLANAKSILFAGMLLALWLTVVVFASTRHEFTRDEVKALSFARAATSPVDLYRLIQYEGHPILWYMLLYLGKSIVDTPLVLPVTSIVVAFAAVAVFMFFSPFPLWFKCLFIFNALPLYEYSVMARNYGISMLLLFIGATLYQKREAYAFWLASVLALLANTNIHSVIFASLIVLIWLWDTLIEQHSGSIYRRMSPLFLPLSIVFVGILFSIMLTLPKENTILTTAYQGITTQNLVSSLFDAILQPNQTFAQIVPTILPPWWNIALLYFVVFGLAHRPNLTLAAGGALVALGLFFRIGYSGVYRHEGLFLVFIVFLYWLFVETLNKEALSKTKQWLFNMGFNVALVSLALWNIGMLYPTMRTDINHEISSSKAFGEYLNMLEIYGNAIIVAEPDYLLESLPYYASNPLYFPREHRFGTTVFFTTDADYHLSLGELLSAARDIKTHYRQPVLIVLGHWDLDPHKAGEKYYSYNKKFSWNVNEFVDFKESTTLVAEFKSALTDEIYQVYVVIK